MNATRREEENEVYYEAARNAMVEEVREMAADINPRYGTVAASPEVLQAMRQVPRHRFVPRDERCYAYQNRPLGIGYGQTISQPYIVALMTDLLALRPGARVLEIGCGSGYQAAVLAQLGMEVYSVEIVEALAQHTTESLKTLGYDRVQVRTGDGYQGWPEHAPYDGVIVTAGANHVPQPLLDQLRPGGRMVIPLGAAWSTQELLLIRKDQEGGTHTQQIIPVRFVPLTGKGEP